MIKFSNQWVSGMAIAVVIGGVSLAHAVYAADASDDSTEQKSGATMKHEHGLKRLDRRIKELHDTLGITPEQEPQWRKVVKVMRRNEADLHKLVIARHENETANAVDDLKSYESITRAHEEGLKRLIPAFETLYNSLSDDQKESADDMFAQYEGHKGRKAGETTAPEENGNNAPMSSEPYVNPDNNAPPRNN